jgi:hypothetical protein
MSVTPDSLLAGVLPCVISGGRPALKDRPTAKLLAGLHGVTADPVWVVQDDRARGYDRDGHEIVTFTRDWAQDWAAGHWTAAARYQPGDFLGSFTSREWACRTAAERGCWAVLMLDDNVSVLSAFHGEASSSRVIMRHGGLGLFADILAAVTLATNSAMTGAALQAVDPTAEPGRFARPGFPYTIYVEETGPGREPYAGPAEEDILQAWTYAANGTPATAVIVRPLQYRKPTAKGNDRTGMRGFYASNERAVGLQRMAPQMARLEVKAAKANGHPHPRVFHAMKSGVIRDRAPMAVTDPGLFAAARERVAGLVPECAAEFRESVRAKVARRAAKAGGGA